MPDPVDSKGRPNNKRKEDYFDTLTRTVKACLSCNPDKPSKENFLVHIIPVEFKKRKKISDAISCKPPKIRQLLSDSNNKKKIPAFAADFCNRSIVYVVIETDIDDKINLKFAQHKREVHDIFNPKKTNELKKDTNFRVIEKDIISECNKRQLGFPEDIPSTWRDYTGHLYVFSMYFTNKHLTDQEKSYLLDPNLVLYTKNEYDGAINYDDRISKLDFQRMPFKEAVELRCNYCSYFSWSLVLVSGEYTESICSEYIKWEIELQMKWNAAYRYYKSLEKNDFPTFVRNFFRNKALEKLDDFEIKLNSLDEIEDSNRVLSIKEKLIESSKIKTLIYQSRIKLEKRRDGLAIALSSIAVLFSVVSVAIAIFLR